MSGRIQRPRALSATLIVLGLALMAGAGVLMIFTTTGLIDDASGSSGPGTVTGFGSIVGGPTPSDAAPPPIPLTTAPLERIVIPSVDIDAPIVIKGLDENRTMESPDNAYDVAWYDFTAKPGVGSNAVFAGHVDYVNVGPAVFWSLKELVPGASVEIRYADGTTLSYEVSAVNTFDVATAPIDEIVGPTSVDSLTLITCAGNFNRATGQYDKRLVVRAEKV